MPIASFIGIPGIFKLRIIYIMAARITKIEGSESQSETLGTVQIVTRGPKGLINDWAFRISDQQISALACIRSDVFSEEAITETRGQLPPIHASRLSARTWSQVFCETVSLLSAALKSIRTLEERQAAIL